MIAVIIYKDESTKSYANVKSHSYKTKSEFLFLECEHESVRLKDVKTYAIFANNGTELLRVTLQE
jgi:hypothetical protein